MVVFVIVNNNIEKKFLETVVAKDFDEVLRYVDEKYGANAQPLGQSIINDTKGNLVSLQVEDIIKEEYKNK